MYANSSLLPKSREPPSPKRYILFSDIRGVCTFSLLGEKGEGAEVYTSDLLFAQGLLDGIVATRAVLSL